MQERAPVRWMVTVFAPVIALVAFATFLAWDADLDPNRTGDISFFGTGVALTASVWAILAAPTRWAQLLAVAALVLAGLTAVFWFIALQGLLRTT